MDASKRLDKLASSVWSEAPSSSSEATSTTMTESSLRSSTDTYRAGSRWFLNQPTQSLVEPVEETQQVRRCRGPPLARNT